jgi:hypothetical protein
MTVTMFHGNADELALHPGLCLADDDAARDYAGYASSSEGRVHEVELDLDVLTIVELEQGHDWDSNTAPGDGGEEYRDESGNLADIIVFADGTACGRRHETWRLMTGKALGALTVTGCEKISEDDE